MHPEIDLPRLNMLFLQKGEIRTGLCGNHSLPRWMFPRGVPGDENAGAHYLAAACGDSLSPTVRQRLQVN